MGNQVFRCLGLKNPNRNDEHKTIMDEGTSTYVNEAKTREIRLRECIVEKFNSGRMSRDDLKALEEVEKFNTAEQGLSGSCTEWRPHKVIHDEYTEELTAGENKQPHMTDMEPQHTRRENVVTEVLKPKAYQPKSEVKNAAPIDEMMLSHSKKEVGMIGIPMSKDLMEAKFPKSAMGARSVWRGSEEVVVESWNVQMGMFLMDEYSSEKTSRDCLKLLEVEKEFQPGGQRLHGEQTEWKPDIEFPEEITSASKEEKGLPDKVLQDA